MRTTDFDYDLPPELIAQHPAPRRDESRLLLFHRESGRVDHRRFADLPAYLNPGDVLVLNNSRVIPARLRGVNERTGGRFEILLLEENSRNDWWVMMRPGKRAHIGTRIALLEADGSSAGVGGIVKDVNNDGHRRLVFDSPQNLEELLPQLGEVPLPPYITRTDPGNSTEDRERYQTVFAAPAGSVAAPTAGLHFTEALLQKITALGVNVQFVTLHVGLATFAPVKVETLAAHNMQEERYEVSEATACAVNAAKAAGRRVIAVGTTSVRVLETIAARHGGKLVAERGRTRMFIHPPYTFRLVDALLTNFHLPCSTLLMLVSAFAAPGTTLGKDMVLTAYAEAIAERYRFFSYGDAMLVI